VPSANASSLATIDWRASMKIPTPQREADLADVERRWEQQAAIDGAAPAATDSGLPVKVAYTPLDAPQEDYIDALGMPGEYPYTRGIYPTMFRGRLWTMRLYSGWGTPEDTNERFRYLLERGQTGLSVALDLPTQMGMDSDHVLAVPEIGKVGVAIDSIEDMERIFEGIPLERISTSFTINATAPILLAMYQVVGERQGVDPHELRGTVQNDILKEYLARKTYIHPPGPSLRLVADVIEYSSRAMPRFNPISVCGYHMRQAGCDAVQEVALTIANASAYADALVERGLPVDSFAPRFSFNLSVMRDFFEEVAKLRAARRIWARTMRERFGAEDPRSWTLRLFSGGDGTSLTAVEPHNNIMRITLQALAIVLGGAQAIHTISWDEAMGIPTEASSLLALRTQQILAYESGVARTADPLGGSYYMESLTNELERRITGLIDTIESRGGVVAGIEDGSLESAIADSAYEQQRRIEGGEHVVIGVNRFALEDQEPEPVETFVVGREVIDRQLARLARVRVERDEAAAATALNRLEAVAATDENLMPSIVDAVRTRATVGEITEAMGRVFGYHKRSTVT
jgi:methylmalonyl-CoA mutase N-terminal domain/subunit